MSRIKAHACLTILALFALPAFAQAQQSTQGKETPAAAAKPAPSPAKKAGGANAEANALADQGRRPNQSVGWHGTMNDDRDFEPDRHAPWRF